jgi:hypothetical protein
MNTGFVNRSLTEKTIRMSKFDDETLSPHVSRTPIMNMSEAICLYLRLNAIY